VNCSKLSKFDLVSAGHLISGEDRDRAFQAAIVLGHIKSSFIEAVAAFALFQPVTEDNFRKWYEQRQSPYERCLNSIYAKAFVLSLDAIEKLLSRLCQYLSPPPGVTSFHNEYQSHFGHLKHIRDSAIHIEDRGRGLTRKQSTLKSRVIELGNFHVNRITFTGEDGKTYTVEISEVTLNQAHRILQGVINAYEWK